jgi:hypothetical protein
MNMAPRYFSVMHLILTTVGALRRTHADVVDDWFATSDAAKEAQPHWMTPVVTVTPRVEQEFRYDQSRQTRPKSVDLDNYGAGKGLEPIPTSDSELILGVPTAEKDTLGMPMTLNTAFQLHPVAKLWPELEVNYTHFKYGDNVGKNQIAMTAGVIAGRFEWTRCARFIFGGGYQKTIGGFRTFGHAWLLTARAAF